MSCRAGGSSSSGVDFGQLHPPCSSASVREERGRARVRRPERYVVTPRGRDRIARRYTVHSQTGTAAHPPCSSASVREERGRAQVRRPERYVVTPRGRDRIARRYTVHSQTGTAAHPPSPFLGQGCPKNVCRNRAATKDCPLRIRPTSPLRLTAWLSGVWVQIEYRLRV